MRILVTGADGFVGRHLTAHLRANGDEVVEAHGPRAGDGHALDVTSLASTEATVARARPDGIIHLAGFSSVGASHNRPAEALQVNVLGTAHLLAAVRAHAPRARVLLIGSGEVYGAVAPGGRVDEAQPLAPTSPYASGKAAAELVAQQFQRSYGLDVLCARPFNHLGTGQAPAFVVPAFAAQVAAIRKGTQAPELKVGNLEPVRDFSHVEDVIRAYRLLLDRGVAGEVYNVCSGTPRSIRSILDELLALAGVQAQIVADPERFRPADIPYLVGDPSKLERLGWRRSRTVAEALREVLDEASR